MLLLGLAHLHFIYNESVMNPIDMDKTENETTNKANSTLNDPHPFKSLEAIWEHWKHRITTVVATDANLGSPTSKFDAGNRLPSHPFVSGDTFRSMADHLYDETSSAIKLSDVKPHDVIFIKSDMAAGFCTNVFPQLQVPIIMLSHNSDDGFPRAPECTGIIDQVKLTYWMGQNLMVAMRPKLLPVPIGLANRYWSHGDIHVVAARARQFKSFMDRDILVYMNFGSTTSARGQIAQMVKDHIPEATAVTQKKSYAEYLEDLSRSKFVVSPLGNGLDCHRTWESLLMGAIPIVESSTLNPLYEDLPVMIVSDYKSLTKELLDLFLKKLPMRFTERSLDKLFSAYWQAKIVELKAQAQSSE